MHSRYITQALLLALGLALGLDCAAQAAAAAPVFGGWRNLHSANGVEPAQEDLAFAMLPVAATRGSRFAILDREANRVVCCMVVSSDRLEADVLENQYKLPGVWVSDLLNEGTDSTPPYLPRVYAMKRDGVLASYVFHDAIEAYSDLGGLLLPADASIDASGTVTAGARRYRLQFNSTTFADEGGALDRFSLRPLGTPAAPVIVEVPYATY